MTNQNLTDAEIDQIIAEVEQTLSKAGELSKAVPPRDEQSEEAEGSAPPEEAAAPAPDAASPEAPPVSDEAPPQESAPATSEAPAEEPPLESAAPEAGEGELAEDVPLTEEELDQIYGGLSPQEWERHYMAIRRNAPAEYMQQDQQAAPEAQAAPAPAPEAPPASAQPYMKSEPKQQSEFESLKDENAQLKKEQDGIKKSMELMVKAIEAGFVPQRKSVEGLEFIKKSAADSPDAQPLSKSEMKTRIDAFYRDNSKVSTLSKADRDAVDNYLLHGTNQKAVEKVLNLGGKQ